MSKVGKPAKYGERKTHTVRVPDVAWENVRSIAALHNLSGVAELLIMIGTGKLAVVSSQTHTHLTEDLDTE